MNNLKNMYEMQKLEQENRGDETRSPYINELIKLVKRIKENNATQEELVENVNTLTEMFDGLKQVADYLKATQPPSDDFETNYARLQELLSLCKDTLPEFELYYEDGNEEHLDLPLENIKKYIAEIFEITDAFQNVEQNQKVYAGSIEINELLRIGYGYCDGIYELVPFIERVDVAAETINKSYTQMKVLAEQPADTKALEKNMPEILKVLEEINEAISKVKEFTSAEGKDKDGIRKNLEIIEKGAKRISEIQAEIAEEIAKIEEEKTMRVCPWCGAKTSIYEKNCQKCNKLLPPPPEGPVAEKSSLNVVATEGGVSGQGASANNGQRIITPNVGKMYKAALALAQGESTPEEFGKMIEWYGGLTDKAKADFESITEPEDMSAEERQLFNEAYELFRDGVYIAIDGLNELQAYFADNDLSHISNGMNLLIDSGEKMYMLESMGDIISKRIEAGGAPINPDGTPYKAEESAEEVPVQDPGLA